MQKEKYRLESDLKSADMKLILLYEELILLKSMEDKDQELSNRLQQAKAQRGLIIRGITSISRQLQDKREKIDEIQIKETDIKKRFHELCPEGSEKYDVISAFFEKLNIKRRKPETKAGQRGRR
jgi:HD superfamily phosphohydrolase